MFFFVTFSVVVCVGVRVDAGQEVELKVRVLGGVDVDPRLRRHAVEHLVFGHDTVVARHNQQQGHVKRSRAAQKGRLHRRGVGRVVCAKFGSPDE